MLLIHFIFSIKYLKVTSVFFLNKNKEKSNNSGYSPDQLNKLVLFKSYGERERERERDKRWQYIYKAITITWEKKIFFSRAKR